MEIQSNSRQIPSDKMYTANKKYSDILYGYLQYISHFDEDNHVRFIFKKEINYKQIGEAIGMHRQTVSSKFKELMAQGLITFDEDRGRYDLDYLDGRLATLLPNNTIRILCSNFKERSISILAYLLKTNVQHGGEPCQINIDIIKEYVGLNKKNRGYNNQVIKDCFTLLQWLGLIQFHTERAIDEKTMCYKTIYILDSVNNDIDFEK